MKKHLAVGIVAGLLTFIVVLLGANSSTIKPLGSVNVGNGYHSTTTRSTSASGTAGFAACTSGGLVGSITVNQVGSAGYVQLWDATSTATSTYVIPSPFSSSTYAVAVGRPIAKVLGSSDAAGTLTYDLNTFYGLVVETSTGFDGEYTVTYRCN